MPNRHSPAVSPLSSLEDTPETRAMKAKLRQKILEGEKRRMQEKRVEKEEEAERQEDEEARKAMERGDISNYISVILIGLLFVSLPLAEKTIDWTQVCLAIGTNVVYGVLFHRHTWMHYCTFLMINLLLVQWGPFVYHVPDLLAAIPAIYYFIFFLGNSVLIAIPYSLYIRPLDDNVKEQRRKREQYWDIVATVVLLANFGGLMATGVIPVSLMMKALRSMLSLLTHFSIDPEQ